MDVVSSFNSKKAPGHRNLAVHEFFRCSMFFAEFSGEKVKTIYKAKGQLSAFLRKLVQTICISIFPTCQVNCI